MDARLVLEKEPLIGDAAACSLKLTPCGSSSVVDLELAARRDGDRAGGREAPFDAIRDAPEPVGADGSQRESTGANVRQREHNGFRTWPTTHWEPTGANES